MMADRPPNLLLLMTDHGRADSLDMVQAGVEVCPHINRLAARSWRADRCYNTSPLCVPARTALATGHYPATTGVVCNEFIRGSRTRLPTLHERLGDMGYDIAHIGIDHIATDPPYRERIGFDAWVSNAEHEQYLRERGIEPHPPGWPDRFKRVLPELCDGEILERAYSNTEVARWDGPAEAFTDRWWCGRAAKYLHNRESTRPFAMFVYLWAPHPPLVLPEPYFSMFDPDGIDLPANVGVPNADEPDGYRDAPAARLAEGVDDAQWRRVWAAHLGLTRLADDALGEVFSALYQSPHADDTIVAFTSDHGDHLGQHDMFQKMEMYEQAVRVPLLISGANIAPVRCERIVSHLDLTATLLDLAGGDASALAGQPLTDTFRGDGSLPADRHAFIQYSGNPTLGDLRRCVVGERWKYTWSPGGEELFDLTQDPLEIRNLADRSAHAAELDAMRRRLREWAVRQGDHLFLDNPNVSPNV